MKTDLFMWQIVIRGWCLYFSPLHFITVHVLQTWINQDHSMYHIRQLTQTVWLHVQLWAARKSASGKNQVTHRWVTLIGHACGSLGVGSAGEAATADS